MKWVHFLLLLTSISALDLTKDPDQFTNILKTELTYGTDPRHEPEFDAIVSYNTGTPDSGYTDNSWTLPPPGNLPTETYDGSYGDIMTRAECVAWGKRTFESSFTGNCDFDANIIDNHAHWNWIPAGCVILDYGYASDCAGSGCTCQAVHNVLSPSLGSDASYVTIWNTYSSPPTDESLIAAATSDKPMYVEHVNVYTGKTMRAWGVRKVSFGKAAILTEKWQRDSGDDGEFYIIKESDPPGDASAIHQKEAQCVTDDIYTAFQFLPDELTNTNLAKENIFDAECVTHLYKDRKLWTQYANFVETNKYEEECCNDCDSKYDVRKSEMVSWTRNSGDTVADIPEHQCVTDLVSSQTWTAGSATTFTETYRKENECLEGGDTYYDTDIFTYNVDVTSNKPSRDDAVAPMGTETWSGMFPGKITYGTNEPGDAYTIMVWVENGAVGTIIDWGVSLTVTSGDIFSHDAGPYMITSSDGVGYNNYDATSMTPEHTLDTAWNHVAVTYDGTATTMYVNGQKSSASTILTTRWTDISNKKIKVSSATTYTLAANAELFDQFGTNSLGSPHNYWTTESCYEKADEDRKRYFDIVDDECLAGDDVEDELGSTVHTRSFYFDVTPTTSATLGGLGGKKLDELILVKRSLTQATIQASMTGSMPWQITRFDGTSEVTYTAEGLGGSTKVSWTQYPNFDEEHRKHLTTDEIDEIYDVALANHDSYHYSGEGRGRGIFVKWTEYVSIHTATSVPPDVCDSYNADMHTRYLTSAAKSEADCLAETSTTGICVNPFAENVEESACTGTWYPNIRSTWAIDAPTITYDVLEDDCLGNTPVSEIWSPRWYPLVIGQHTSGPNNHIYNEHERSFHWDTKVGGSVTNTEMTSLLDTKQWCRSMPGCAGVQRHGDFPVTYHKDYYPTELTTTMPTTDNDNRYPSRYTRLKKKTSTLCKKDGMTDVTTALQCYHGAQVEFNQNQVYVKDDEFINHNLGTGTYEYHDDPTIAFGCHKSGTAIRWNTDSTISCTSNCYCLDQMDDYEYVPIHQPRWQREKDIRNPTKEEYCTPHRLEWNELPTTVITKGTKTKPHFTPREGPSWISEPIQCLYDGSYAISGFSGTLEECHNEAVFWGAIAYSYKFPQPFVYQTARHFTHVVEARAACDRLVTAITPPTDTWELCTNAGYDCSDGSCINEDTPDNTMYGRAACCDATAGAACYVSAQLGECNYKEGFAGYHFRDCTGRVFDESNDLHTYNVYDPGWDTDEWRRESNSRAYMPPDEGVPYTISGDRYCPRENMLSEAECEALHEGDVDGYYWNNDVIYDKQEVAGCSYKEAYYAALGGTYKLLQYNKYRYITARRAVASNNEYQMCNDFPESYTNEYSYHSTGCVYANYDGEFTDIQTRLDCQAKAEDTTLMAALLNKYTQDDLNTPNSLSLLDMPIQSYSYDKTNKVCRVAFWRGPCVDDSNWVSHFKVNVNQAIEAVSWTRNTENEIQVDKDFYECVENQTRTPNTDLDHYVHWKQVPWTDELDGWWFGTELSTETTLDAAKVACEANSECDGIFYWGTAANYFLVNHDEFKELDVQKDPTYYLPHKHIRRNREFYNKKHFDHPQVSTKELCIAKCDATTLCSYATYRHGYCFLYEESEMGEVADTAESSMSVYRERHGAAVYQKSTGTCSIYKNEPTIALTLDGSTNVANCKLHTDSADADDVSFPIDAKVMEKTSVAFINLEPKQDEKVHLANIITEERTKQWCDERFQERITGTAVWTQYPDVTRTFVKDQECSIGSTWTRYTPVNRTNVLQRECELIDSRATFVRHDDVVSRTGRDTGTAFTPDYQTAYYNGYRQHTGKCHPYMYRTDYVATEYEQVYNIDSYSISSTEKHWHGTATGTFGTAGKCYSATAVDCNHADLGYGYWLSSPDTCHSYYGWPGSNHSDCIWHHPGSEVWMRKRTYPNLNEAIDRCNDVSMDCDGICEEETSLGREFSLIAKDAINDIIITHGGTGECYRGWTGADCTTQEPINSDIVSNIFVSYKYSTAVKICEKLDRKVCSHSEVSDTSNKRTHFADSQASVNADFSAMYETYDTYCCGKEEYKGHRLRLNRYYYRHRSINTCQDPRIDAPTANPVMDNRPKVITDFRVKYSGKPNLSLNADECKLYAQNNGLTWLDSYVESSAYRPAGCVLRWGSQIRYNQHTNEAEKQITYATMGRDDVVDFSNCGHQTLFTNWACVERGNIRDTPQVEFKDILGDCDYHFAVRDPPIVSETHYQDCNDDDTEDNIHNWKCQQAEIELVDRVRTWNIHSFNETIKFDVMKNFELDDTESFTETYIKFAHTYVNGPTTLPECLDQLEASAGWPTSNHFVYWTGTNCIKMDNAFSDVKVQSSTNGMGAFAERTYEGPYTTLLNPFSGSTPLETYDIPSRRAGHTAYAHHPDEWLVSTGIDYCELACEQTPNCKLYVLGSDGVKCHLYPEQQQVVLNYLRSIDSGYGFNHNVAEADIPSKRQFHTYVKTEQPYVCRWKGTNWTLAHTVSQGGKTSPIKELLAGPNIKEEVCRRYFLNDARVPTLDQYEVDDDGNCYLVMHRYDMLALTDPDADPRFSLDVSKAVEESVVSNNVYHLAVNTAMGRMPYRVDSTAAATEDMLIESCREGTQFTNILPGFDCMSINCAPFWIREEDIIQQEILESDCPVILPPQRPHLAYDWTRYQQPIVTYHIEEDTCKDSAVAGSGEFVSWTPDKGVKHTLVMSDDDAIARAECDALNGMYIGKKQLEGDFRSSCNGISSDVSYEKLFRAGIIESGSATSLYFDERDLSSCARKAEDYYSHFNRSSSSKIFEWREGDNKVENCRVFVNEECAQSCFADNDRVNVQTYIIHDEENEITAASCWLLSVLDNTQIGQTYCRQCPKGKFNSRAASNCLPCPQGRFADEEGLKACKVCPSDSFQWGSGESHCHHCAPGQYQDEFGKRFCKICGAGKFLNADGTVCLDCPIGRSASSNYPINDASRLLYTGKATYKGPLIYYDTRFDYSGVHGNSVKDVNGDYLTGYSPIFTLLRNMQGEEHNSIDDCISCEAGTYADALGTVECKACEKGTYQTEPGSGACKTCYAGSVATFLENTGNNTGIFNDYSYMGNFQCDSSEKLGEYRDSNGLETLEDVGLIGFTTETHLRFCFAACKNHSACLYVTYEEATGTCYKYRKCDEMITSSLSTYMRTRVNDHMEYSGEYQQHTEWKIYGPSHHTCQENPIAPVVTQYIEKQDNLITAGNDVGSALTISSAIEQCNAMPNCFGFTYEGIPNAIARTFTASNPILLKGHADIAAVGGYQSYFKEEPVTTVEDCQNNCAVVPNCNFMAWNETKICLKYETCTLQKKPLSFLNTETSSQIWSINRASSYKLFNFHGTWPCDATTFTGITLEQCERNVVYLEVPMFYYSETDGSCHAYTFYGADGIRDLYKNPNYAKIDDMIICRKGVSSPPFDFSQPGFVRAIGKRNWHTGATHCTSCPSGLHTAIDNQFSCRQCKIGNYDKYGNSASNAFCTSCELGRFQDEFGQSNCKACSPGRYQDEIGTFIPCKASGQGYETLDEGQIATFDDLNTGQWSSGAMQTNTIKHVRTQHMGSTAKSICGRNLYNDGYENIWCKSVPKGSISVTKQPVWIDESAFSGLCKYVNDNIVTTINLGVRFLDEETGYFRTLIDLESCIDYAKEHKFVVSIYAISKSSENCVFSTLDADGNYPICREDENYQSYRLLVGSASYDSKSMEPAADPLWFFTWNSHNVEYASPYQCQGLYYEDRGIQSPSDCVQMCRMQQFLEGEAGCRFVAYDGKGFNNTDGKCYFVNWHFQYRDSGFSSRIDLNSKAGFSNVNAEGLCQTNDCKIFRDTLENIDGVCESNIQSVSVDSNTGKGFYATEEYVPANTRFANGVEEILIEPTCSSDIWVAFGNRGIRDFKSVPSRGWNGHVCQDGYTQYDIPCVNEITVKNVRNTFLNGADHPQLIPDTTDHTEWAECDITDQDDSNFDFNTWKSDCKWKRRQLYTMWIVAAISHFNLNTDEHPDYTTPYGYGSDCTSSESPEIGCTQNKYQMKGFYDFQTNMNHKGLNTNAIYAYCNDPSNANSNIVNSNNVTNRVSFKKTENIGYTDNVLPLYDAGTNFDNFYDSSTIVNRAKLGGNDYESCNTGYANKYKLNWINSCDELGFPWFPMYEVGDQTEYDEMLMGKIKWCSKLAPVTTGSGGFEVETIAGIPTKCCIDVTDESICATKGALLCLNIDVGTKELVYRQITGINYGAKQSGVVHEIISANHEKGKAQIIDYCNALGDECEMVTCNDAANLYKAYQTGTGLEFVEEEVEEVYVKYPDWTLHAENTAFKNNVCIRDIDDVDMTWFRYETGGYCINTNTNDFLTGLTEAQCTQQYPSYLYEKQYDTPYSTQEDCESHSDHTWVTSDIVEEADSLLACARACQAAKRCRYFSMSYTVAPIPQTDAKGDCIILSEPSLSGTMAFEGSAIFFLNNGDTEYGETETSGIRNTQVGDTYKSQFCFGCQVGKYGSSSTVNSIGECAKCNRGSISATNELNAELLHEGTTLQERCQVCPLGMWHSEIDGSCRACDENMLCAFESLTLPEMCDAHEYSSGSLVEFRSEGQATRGSLTCSKCPAGKYNNEIHVDTGCITCPQGFFSERGRGCVICPPGKYTISAGSELCLDGDGGVFYPWPASTASDDFPVNNDKCCTDLADDCAASDPQYGFRENGRAQEHDGYCTTCDASMAQPGKYAHWNTFDATGIECYNTNCPVQTYHPTGAEGCKTHNMDTTSGCTTVHTCLPCKTTCNKGYEINKCGGFTEDGLTSDSVCTLCTAGRYQNSNNFAGACKVCGAGHYCEGGNKRHKCPTGKYTTLTTATSSNQCTNWKTCKAWNSNAQGSEYMVQDGTHTTDRICNSCPSYMAATAQNQLVCQLCFSWEFHRTGECTSGHGAMARPNDPGTSGSLAVREIACAKYTESLNYDRHRVGAAIDDFPSHADLFRHPYFLVGISNRICWIEYSGSSCTRKNNPSYYIYKLGKCDWTTYWYDQLVPKMNPTNFKYLSGAHQRDDKDFLIRL